MNPEPFVSVIVDHIPDWLDQTHVENWVRTVPDLVQVRKRVCFRDRSQYDLIFDFKPGADAYSLMGIPKEQPTVVFDHQEFMVYPVTQSYDLKDATIVSRVKPIHYLADDFINTMPQHYLKLDRLALKKAECCICRDALAGSFTTPCWSCKRAECHDCIRNHFRSALQDFERFPAKCCNAAFHPDVAKGILPEAELVKYRVRLEEWLTQHPFYCPVSKCSTFIPPRQLRLHDKDNIIECSACQTSICIICKQQAHLGQPCEGGDQKNEELDVLTKFGYKQCPRCGIAVGKMYGCSHVQCNCGAHWCWECRRKIEVCNVMPCDGSYEDGYDDFLPDTLSDIDSVDGWDDGQASTHLREQQPGAAMTTPLMNLDLPMTESDAHTTQSAHVNESKGNEIQHAVDAPPPNIVDERMSEVSVAIVAVTPLPNIALPLPEMQPGHEESVNSSARPQLTEHPDTTTDSETTKPEQSELVNLDDPRHIDWNATELNFGDEPVEDDSLDVWGCVHNFEPAAYNKVPRFWMTASIPDWWDRAPDEREVDCMICWRATKLAPKLGEIEKLEDGLEKRKKIKDWRFARRCRKCSIIVCRKCRNELVKTDT